MEMRFEGRYTERDRRQILGLGFAGGARLFAIVFGLAALGFALWTVARAASASDWELATLFQGFLPALVFLLLAGVFWRLPHNQAREVAESPLLEGWVSGVATDEELVLKTARSEARLAWDAFTQYKQSDEMVLLYRLDGGLLALPRRFFATDDDWQHLMLFVQATVPASQRLPSHL